MLKLTSRKLVPQEIPQRVSSSFRPRAARLAALAAVFCLAAAWAAEGEPRFNDSNELIRPEGYREWVFVGASLAMSYDEDKGDENKGEPEQPMFHNIYLHPAAYREYKSKGTYPEGTILVMEVLTAGSQSSINRQGQFEDKLVGVEAAVKDSTRFKESWAYFSFSNDQGPLKTKTKAFAKERCWSCHSEHAATDNVFSQFYPVLRKSE